MRHTAAILLIGLLAATACGGGESSVSAPPTGGSTPPPSGGVQRTILSVTVRPESPDLLIARTLGWPDAIPGATVVLRREGGTDVTTQTTAQGIATFTDLLEGNYQVTVTRAFTTTELGTLAPADRDLSAWGGARSVAIGNTGGTLPFEVSVAAIRRGSLVFSEILSGAFITFQPNGTRYNFSGFLELYNNSDTAITLDGILMAVTMSPSRDYGGTFCTLSRDLYADTAGVWADIVYQFPPIGRRLDPGEFVTIATDAIDHRPFGVRDVYDLTNADYEVYQGPGDVDNPSVPNMISVGTVMAHSALTTHGTDWIELNNAIALAAPQNIATLVRRLHLQQNHDYLFLPRATLLDVFSYYREDPRFPPLCAPAVGANLDASPTLIGADALINVSFQRTRLSGQRYLQRSRSSARDYSLLVPTPFSVP